jgi:hypothetical protein
MKKGICGLLVVLLTAVAALGLFASAADDYKVVKNAVHNPAGGGAAQWFKIVVTGKSGKADNVKVTLPVSLVEIMMNATPDKDFRIDGDCHVDLKRVWNDLKKAGPMSLVEVETEDGETVRIWLE